MPLSDTVGMVRLEVLLDYDGQTAAIDTSRPVGVESSCCTLIVFIEGSDVRRYFLSGLLFVLQGLRFRLLSLIVFTSCALQMNMMANAGPYGGPYGQSAGQGMPGAGLGPQLQNKAGLPNNMAAQFNMDKKAQPGQGMPGMVRPLCFLFSTGRASFKPLSLLFYFIFHHFSVIHMFFPLKCHEVVLTLLFELSRDQNRQ